MDMIKHLQLDERYMNRVIATAALAGAVIVTSPGSQGSTIELHFLETDSGKRTWYGSRFEAAQAFLAAHDIVVK